MSAAAPAGRRAAAQEIKPWTLQPYMLYGMMALVFLVVAVVGVQIVRGFRASRGPSNQPQAAVPSTVAAQSPQSVAPNSAPPTLIAQLPSAPQSAVPQTNTSSGLDAVQLLWQASDVGYVIVGNIVFTQDASARIQALDFVAGNPIWTTNSNGKMLAADSAHVYVSPSNQRIEALDARNGEESWRLLLSEPMSQTGSMIIGGHLLYVPTASGTYIVVDGNTGTETGTVENRSLQVFGSVLVKDSLVGVSTDSNQVLWDISSLGTYPTFCGDLVVYPTMDGSTPVIQAINIDSGRQVWTATLPEGDQISCPTAIPTSDGPLYSPLTYSLTNFPWPAPDLDAELIYLTPGVLSSGKLIAIEKDTGKIRWSGLTIDGPQGSANNYRWLGEFAGKVFYSHSGFGLTQAYDIASHQLAWENSQDVVASIHGVIGNTMIAEVSSPGQLLGPVYVVGLDVQTGKEKWRLQHGLFDNVGLMLGRVFIVPQGESTAIFIDPDAGTQQSSISLAQYGWSGGFFAPFNGYIVAFTWSRIAVIKP